MDVSFLFMTKPPFLLCPGVGKSGTSSLFEMLQNYNNFIHCGICKETGYLSLVDMCRNKHLYKNFDVISLHHRSLLKEWKNYIPNFETQLPEKIYSDYTSQYYSLSTYYEYYVNVYEIVKSVYHGVGDFSTSYCQHQFAPGYLKEIDTCLSNFFTVKIVLLFRDPIKRLFSNCHMKKLILNHPTSASDLFNQDIYNYNIQNLYPDTYHKFHQVFGDRILLLNEKIFDPNDHTQRSKLEQFLNLPPINTQIIPKSNTQIYTEPLSNCNILKAKELLKPSYDFYNQIFYT